MFLCLINGMWLCEYMHPKCTYIHNMQVVILKVSLSQVRMLRYKTHSGKTIIHTQPPALSELSKMWKMNEIISATNDMYPRAQPIVI